MKITMSLNEHEINMVKILTKPRPTFLSETKVRAVLETNNNPNNIETIEKHGRELYRIKYPDGRQFTLGLNKINTVLDHAEQITKLLA